MTISTGDKLKVSLSIVYVFFATLLSLAINSDSSSSFKGSMFVFVAAATCTPILLYWLGYWVWGSGYVFSGAAFPFKLSWSFIKLLLAEAPINSPAYPWPRYWAKMVDILIFSGLFWFALGYFAPDFARTVVARGDADNPVISNLVFLPFIVILNGFFSWLFGNSIGKQIVGIKLQHLSGAPIALKTHIQRELMVLWRGLGMGIPFVALFTQLNAQKKLIKGELVSWDKDLQTTVLATHSSILRTGIGIGISVTLFAGYIYLEANTPLPMTPVRAAGQQIRALTAEEQDRQFEKEMLAGAGEMPRMIDEITRLDSISYRDKVIEYHHTIVDRPSGDPTLTEFEPSMHGQVRKNVCSQPDLIREVLNKGYTMAYEYRGNDGMPFAAFAVPPRIARCPIALSRDDPQSCDKRRVTCVTYSTPAGY